MTLGRTWSCCAPLALTAVALLVGAVVSGALMLVSIYVLWTQTHPLDLARRARLDGQVPRVVFGVVVHGIVGASGRGRLQVGEDPVGAELGAQRAVEPLDLARRGG